MPNKYKKGIIINGGYNQIIDFYVNNFIKSKSERNSENKLYKANYKCIVTKESVYKSI